jgi:hypothetical protein
MRSLPWVARLGAATFALTCAAALSAPAPAQAENPVKAACGLVGWFSGIAGKVCGGAVNAGRIVSGGRKLFGGRAGNAAGRLLDGGAGRAAATAAGLAAIGAWVLVGARAALHEAETEIGRNTRPELTSTWFSATYWRLAGLATLLTLPFLFAAAVQALIRSDVSLLVRAALGYLPVALIAISIAAPLTTMLLAGSDQMCTIVADATGHQSVGFLARIGGEAGALSMIDGSPFLAFLTGALLAGAALAVSLELLIREAAVYVVVLMLPLAFAAMVWPARRIWALRLVETLIALILAKFAIVAVLALAGGALGSGGMRGLLAATALLMLAAVSPVVLFRLLPFAELSATASGAFRGHGERFGRQIERTAGAAGDAEALVAWMRRDGEALPAPGADAAGDAAESQAPPPPGGRPEGLVEGAVETPPEPGQTEPGQTEPGRTEPGQTEPGQTEPGQTEPGRTGPKPARGQPPGEASGERLPGMDPIWQAPDMSWRPLQLGPGEEWPSELWAPEPEREPEPEPKPDPGPDPGDGADE